MKTDKQRRNVREGDRGHALDFKMLFSRSFVTQKGYSVNISRAKAPPFFLNFFLTATHLRRNGVPQPFFFCGFWIHTASAPSTTGTSSGAGAVLGKPRASPARRHSRSSCHMFVRFVVCSFSRLVLDSGVGLSRISSQVPVSDSGEWRRICHFFFGGKNVTRHICHISGKNVTLSHTKIFL